MTDSTEKPHGLYYRYTGRLASDEEKERLVHGPANKEECERVQRAKENEHVGGPIGVYTVRVCTQLKSQR